MKFLKIYTHFRRDVVDKLECSNYLFFKDSQVAAAQAYNVIQSSFQQGKIQGSGILKSRTQFVVINKFIAVAVFCN
jgi:hypothetical protein